MSAGVSTGAKVLPESGGFDLIKDCRVLVLESAFRGISGSETPTLPSGLLVRSVTADRILHSRV